MDPHVETNAPLDSPPNRKVSPKMILGFLIGILILGGILGIAFTGIGNRNTNEQENNDSASEEKFLAPYILLYGAWKGDSAVIYANDLSTSKEYELAVFPENIKKVTPISSNEMLYIADTNNQDHGQSLKIRDLTTGKDTAIYSALDGYGIDDYRISPNGRYLATWEVKFEPNNKTLTGGNSKVTTIDRQNPTSTNTIYEELANQPVHYPVGVTDEGKVFLDTFLPNTGAGWAYGMSVSDFKGTTKTDLTELTNGNYGTQPVMSPSGKYITIAGYDGSQGPGAEEIIGGRRAILTPNTILLLNTATNEVENLNNFPNTSIVSLVAWSKNNLLITNITSPPTSDVKSGTYLINIDSQSHQESFMGNTANTLVLNMSDPYELSGVFDPSNTTMGNLGPTYGYLYKSLTITNSKSKSKETILTSAPLTQFVDLKPEGFYKLSEFKQSPNLGQQESEKNQLEIDTFTLKPDLEPTRTKQQTDPSEPEITPTAPQTTQAPVQPGAPKPKKTIAPNNPDAPSACPDIVLKACGPKPPLPNPAADPSSQTSVHNAIMKYNECTKANMCGSEKIWPTCEDMYKARVIAVCGVVPTRPPANDPNQGSAFEKISQWNQCKDSAIGSIYQLGICAGSPLYLYGPEGLTVNVKIHTPITNANITKTQNTYTPSIYDFILKKNGIFESNGKSYSSLSFDYTPAVYTKPPKYGTVVRKENIEKKVKEYAKNLGLNTRETNDLVTDIKNKATKDYVFLSFFDQETSKHLLPISFDPKPDTYINYVFYIKNLNSPSDVGYTPKEPTFPKPEPRGEFTAVEISLIAE